MLSNRGAHFNGLGTPVPTPGVTIPPTPDYTGAEPAVNPRALATPHPPNPLNVPAWSLPNHGYPVGVAPPVVAPPPPSNGGWRLVPSMPATVSPPLRPV